MGRKLSFVGLDEGQREEIEQWARPGEGYWVVPPEDLPSFIPTGLAEKVHSAVVMVKGMPSDHTLVVVNNHRADQGAWMIDQEPLGAIVYSSGASTGCAIAHHGGWEGRSSTAPTWFWEGVSSSGIGPFYPPPELSASTSGSLDELIGTSHAAVFDAMIARLSSNQST